MTDAERDHAAHAWLRRQGLAALRHDELAALRGYRQLVYRQWQALADVEAGLLALDAYLQQVDVPAIARETLRLLLRDLQAQQFGTLRAATPEIDWIDPDWPPDRLADDPAGAE